MERGWVPKECAPENNVSPLPLKAKEGLKGPGWCSWAPCYHDNRADTAAVTPPGEEAYKEHSGTAGSRGQYDHHPLTLSGGCT